MPVSLPRTGTGDRANLTGVRVVILGGGGFRVPTVVRAIAGRPELGIAEVVLHDVDETRLAVISSVLPAALPGLRLRTTTSLAEALPGADVVFSAIRVGGAEGRVRDERRALALGVLGQETVGAGGLAYGLRTVPVALAAARLQAELAPDAWLINFTNPAGLITQALSEPMGRKVIGICDSPVGLIRRVCRSLAVAESSANADYLGINHLGWLRSLSVDDRDLLPGLLADDRALDGFEEGRLFGATILRSLRSVPNEYLHFYYAAREMVADLAAESTRGEVLAAEQSIFYRTSIDDLTRAPALWEAARLRREETYLAETRCRHEQRDDADLSGGGYQEVALDLIGALTGGPPVELIVNAVNGPAVPALPPSMMLEARCRVDTTGATVLPASPLDLHQLGLVASVRAAEQAVITAVTHGSRADAVRAFAIHPLIGSWPIAEQLTAGVVADHPELAALLR